MAFGRVAQRERIGFASRGLWVRIPSRPPASKEAAATNAVASCPILIADSVHKRLGSDRHRDEGVPVTYLSAPDMPAEEWAHAAKERRARRSFDGSRVDEAALDELEHHCEGFAPSDQARTVLIRRAPESIFAGVVGSYGRIRGASSALVMLGQAGDGHGRELAGYIGQAAVLAAMQLGLDTCWVGGMFHPGRVLKLVRMHAGEKVYAISPVGYAEEKLSGPERRVYRMKSGTPKSRKPLDEIAAGWQAWPAWTHAAVRAARIAPSAMNRQPWRFRWEGGAMVVSFEGSDTPKISKRLDCGIAMLNAEVGLRSGGMSGQWELLDHGTDVARFVAEEGT